MQLDEFEYMEHPPFIMSFVRVQGVEPCASSGLSNQKRYKKWLLSFLECRLTRFELFDLFS